MPTTEVNSVRPRIVRITVTDTYATDSSSDEEEVGVSRRRRVKKFVNEVTIGPCVAERGNDVKQAANGNRWRRDTGKVGNPVNRLQMASVGRKSPHRSSSLSRPIICRFSIPPISISHNPCLFVCSNHPMGHPPQDQQYEKEEKVATAVAWLPGCFPLSPPTFPLGIDEPDLGFTSQTLSISSEGIDEPDWVVELPKLSIDEPYLGFTSQTLSISSEGELEEDEVNSGCLGYEKSKEKTPGVKIENKKTIGVRIASPLEDAAKELNVVDEEGIPQLNTDTLPTDQALAVTVNTNSIVRNEIPLPQFSPTVRQKNSDEALGNDEVKESEIWPKRTEEGGIAEVQCDSSFVAKRKRKEKSPRGERRNKKTTGVGIGAPLEDILLTKGMGPKDLAKHMEGVKPTKFERGTRLRQRELKVNDTPSSKKQSKSVEGGTSRSKSGGGLAESNVDVNTAGGKKSSKKWSTSIIGKGEIKIKKPHSTEPTNENEEVRDTAFRSSLRGIITLIKELNLRTCHKEVLKRTPFWGIFEAIIENKLSPKQCRKSDKMIIKIINTYDPAAKIFRLGRESMELTRADMVSIFGISCANKFVDLKYGPKEKVKLVKRREISETRLTSKSVERLLQKYLGSEEEEDVEDVARLLCLYLFHTFLFPTGPTIKWVYLERIEDLDRLRDYDWNEAIINELMSSIRKHHHEPRKVTGCVMALLYWLCERTNLSKPLHPEHPLGIVKWDIPLVVSGFKKMRLKDLKPGQVVSRQANVARTADGEVPVDKDIVQDFVLSGDVPVSNRGNDACSVRGESDEKTLGGGRGNNRTTEARIEIALEDMSQVKEMRLKDASRELQVSEATLKRRCRGYNIDRWPPCEVDKLIDQSRPSESPSVVDQEQICQLNSNQASIETSSVTVKAKYETVTIKFCLSRPWRKVELEENVKKRLGLEFRTYHTEYKDEDGDWILISCDEDLNNCIPNSSPMGTCSIQLFLRDKVAHSVLLTQL